MISFNDQRGVVPAEAKRIGQGHIDLHLAGYIGHIIQITIRVRGFIIDRRMHDIIPDR